MAETSPATEERPEITRAPATALAIGLAAGLMSALLGVGGGLIMVPALVLMLRIRQARAVGTSLAVILPTAVIAANQYHHEALGRGTPGLELAVVLWLAVGGVIGAIFGAKLAQALAARRLRRTFGTLVILTGIGIIVHAYTRLPQAQPWHGDLAQTVEIVAIGTLVGMVSGMLGVGGGVVTVPALSLVLGYSQHQAQGTSLAVIIPVSITGTLAHLLRGNVVWSLAPWLALGAMTGAYFTTGRVFDIPEAALKTVFGVFLILFGLTMVTGGGKKAPDAGLKEGISN